MGRPRALNGTTGASSLRRKTNYKGQVILPFIFFFTYPKCK